jgi:hypothetical protein
LVSRWSPPAMAYWINDAKARYYRAAIVRDLFEEWVLITAWGGLHSHRGNMRSTVLASYEDGIERIAALDKRRRQRGYRRVVRDD